VYSDEFGDIDDMSLFEEPTDHRPYTRLSPPKEMESDLFATDIGDMLDDFSPVNNDKVTSRETAINQDENNNDSSLYGVDEDMLFPLERALNEARQPGPSNAQQGTEKSARPFLEVSDGSAIFELGSRVNDQDSSSAMAKMSLSHSSAMPEDHGTSHNKTFNSVLEERPTSSDSAMKACIEELGTDFFNFTG
jgi:hypothetical protein